MIDDLVAFLKARLDDTAAKATAARGTSWDATPGDVAADAWVINEDMHLFETDAGTAAHIAEHDPSRVLAEVAAKRRLLADLLDEGHERNEDDHWYSCAALVDHDGEPLCIDESRAGGPCDCGRDKRVQRRLALFALPYANHHDYQPEWAPGA